MSWFDKVIVQGITYFAHDNEIQSLKKTENAKKLLRVNTSGDAIDTVAETDIGISTATQTSLDTKADKTTTVNGHALDNNVTVNKSDVGLGNCDNTSDVDKPISTATQTALDAKATTTSINFNGVEKYSAVSSGTISLDNGPIQYTTQTTITLPTVKNGYTLTLVVNASTEAISFSPSASIKWSGGKAPTIKSGWNAFTFIGVNNYWLGFYGGYVE